MERQVKNNPRIEVVDALRGFAVMAIILVHNLEHFIFPVYPLETAGWIELLNRGVFDVTFSLFAGKAYAIFALLFGFTFYIQMNNQRRQGKDFGYRFLWRMVLLAVFATVNAAFFPAGDVLMLFVMVSVVLFLTRNLRDRALLLTSVFFLLQPFEWCQYFASLADPSYRLPDLNIAEMYADVAAVTKTGNLWEFLYENITMGQKASLLWAVGAGRMSQTAGLFLLGFYMGRKRLFVTSEHGIRVWVGILIVSAVAYAPLYALKEMVMDNDPVIRQTAGVVFDMWQKLAFTLVLVASFILLYQNRAFSRRVSSLRYYGKMSLTNYISQSIFGALIYFPVGLYLAPYCGYAVSLLIGLLIFYVQVRFSKWWLSRHKLGPLEYIWHKWTWIYADK